MILVFKTILMFLYLFSFKVPILYNSTLFSLLLLLVIAFMILITRNKFLYINILYEKYIINVLIFLFFIITIALIFPIISGTYDFTIIPTLINQFISFVIAILLVIILRIYDGLEIKQLIIFAFTLQAIIEITAFLNPDFLLIVQFFQNENMIAVGEQYAGGGMRALALSGSQFFGLSSAFGLSYIVAINYFITKGKFTYIDAIIFFILIVGTFFAGRTGFVGLAFAILYLFLTRNSKLTISLFYKIGLSCLIISILFFSFLFSKEIKEFFFRTGYTICI
jgi:hypothetical protein